MNHLQFAVVAVATVLGVVAIIAYACRIYSTRRDQSVKEAQIKYRIEKDNHTKGLAVAELEKELNESLIDIAQQYSGVEALQKARRKVEHIYYVWLSDYCHYFFVGEPPPRITSVRNGYFQYELPDHLKQFTKGKRK